MDFDLYMWISWPIFTIITIVLSFLSINEKIKRGKGDYLTEITAILSSPVIGYLLCGMFVAAIIGLIVFGPIVFIIRFIIKKMEERHERSN